jgi:hypothetical protein
MESKTLEGTGQDLSPRADEGAIARPVRADNALNLVERFTPEQRTQIAQFLNIQGDDPAFLPYLATCATYGLDPIMGQIWLIPQRVKVKDGAGKENWEDRYRPSVGRDGLLAIARRTPEYEGIQGDVVCERDSFEVEYTGAQDDPQVLHRFRSKPTEGEENPDRWRGKILGAWAKVYVRGKRPVFYYAPLREHGKFDADKNKWMGSWGYTSAMIQKAAQSYVLRIALGVTGIVPADELASATSEFAGKAKVDPEEDAVEALREVLRTEDAEVRGALEDAIRKANALEPYSWSAAKVRMRLGDADVDQARAVAVEIGNENLRREGAVWRREVEEAGGKLGVASEVDPGCGVQMPLDEAWSVALDAGPAEGGKVRLVLIDDGADPEETDGEELVVPADQQLGIRPPSA